MLVEDLQELGGLLIIGIEGFCLSLQLLAPLLVFLDGLLLFRDPPVELLDLGIDVGLFLLILHLLDEGIDDL